MLKTVYLYFLVKSTTNEQIFQQRSHRQVSLHTHNYTASLNTRAPVVALAMQGACNTVCKKTNLLNSQWKVPTEKRQMTVGKFAIVTCMLHGLAATTRRSEYLLNTYWACIFVITCNKKESPCDRNWPVMAGQQKQASWLMTIKREPLWRAIGQHFTSVAQGYTPQHMVSSTDQGPEIEAGFGHSSSLL